jgi:hypothetical protein
MSVKSYQGFNAVVKQVHIPVVGSSADNSVFLLDGSVYPAGTYQFNANVGISSQVLNIEFAVMSIEIGTTPAGTPVAQSEYSAPQSFFSGSVSAGVYSDGVTPINITCSANTNNGFNRPSYTIVPNVGIGNSSVIVEVSTEVYPAGTYQLSCNVAFSTGLVDNIASAYLAVEVDGNVISKNTSIVVSSGFSGAVSTCFYSDGVAPVKVLCFADTIDNAGYQISNLYICSIKL